MATTNNKLSGRTKGALWLLIGPTALLITTFILYALVNWAFGSAAGPDVNIGTSIANTLLFIVGLIATLAWLPGLIVGIVLLATAPPKK